MLLQGLSVGFHVREQMATADRLPMGPSLTSKSEIPAWEEMKTFPTLEAIEDMKPTQGLQKIFNSSRQRSVLNRKGVTYALNRTIR